YLPIFQVARARSTGVSADRPKPPRPRFVFQAEDGIRDFHVTGVQTCALPISPNCSAPTPPAQSPATARPAPSLSGGTTSAARTRSEERRVGKEGRTRCPPDPKATMPLPNATSQRQLHIAKVATATVTGEHTTT